MNLYWSLGEPILVAMTTYIGHDADLYRFTSRPILLLRGILRKHLNPYRQEAEEANREETIKAVVTTTAFILIFLVGMRRLELPTSTSRTWRATNCATSRMHSATSR